MKKDRTCTVCRKNYKFCPACLEDANKPTWMFIFCSEKCRAFYNVLNDYRYKLLTKEEACEKLKELDFSEVDKLIPDFRQIYDEITFIEVQKEVQENVQEEAQEMVKKPVRIRQRKSVKEANKE